jgi:hypothetical protein
MAGGVDGVEVRQHRALAPAVPIGGCATMRPVTANTDRSPPPSSLSPSEREAALDLCRFVDASPSPFHAAGEAIARLERVGFSGLEERSAWTLAPGDRRWVRRGGTLIAFVVGDAHPALAGFRMIGAHTDSPNLRAKPIAGRVSRGYEQVGVEIYGAPLLSTWLDRDLSLAGRVTLGRGPGRVQSRLVDLQRPIARVANVAIHLNRGVNKDGLVLNEQKHMVPMLGLGDDADLAKILAAELGEDLRDVLAWDLGFYDTLPSTLGGLGKSWSSRPASTTWAARTRRSGPWARRRRLAPGRRAWWRSTTTRSAGAAAPRGPRARSSPTSPHASWRPSPAIAKRRPCRGR